MIPSESSNGLQGAERGQVWKSRLVLMGLWLIFYGSFTLVAPPLLDDADSVHAEVAREMLLRHDWTTLYANGIRYLEKAPLFYWSMAACMKALGATTVASRLPLAFAALWLALVVESFARRAVGDARAGLYAGLIFLSSFGIFIFSRINIPDVMVCLWLTVALFAYFLTEQDYVAPRRALCYGFAGACALNVLTKGLIGMVFPVGIVAAHLLTTRGWRGMWGRVRQLHPMTSVVVFLAIAVPWHVLAGLANPGHGHPGVLARVDGHWGVPYPTDGNVHGWTWFYFVNEQVYRYLNLRVPHDYDTAPLVVFYGLILVWLMPWSGYLFHAFARAVPLRGAAYRARLRGLQLTALERTNLLLALWAAIPLVFFSLSTRQEYYVLPSLPPMILLIAAWLAVRRDDAAKVRIAGVLAGLGVVGGAACVFLIVKAGTPAPNTDLSTLLQQNPGDYALSFGHFLDLNAQAMGMFRVPLIVTAVALGFGLPVAFWLRLKGTRHAVAFGDSHLSDDETVAKMGHRDSVGEFQRDSDGRAPVLVTAGAAFVFLLAAHQGLVIFSPTLTSYQLARAIAPQVHAEDLIVLHGEYESGSTLGFYLRRNDLHIVEGRSSNLWYGSFFPDAPRIFETRESIARKWSGAQRIFLWQDPHDRERPVLALPAPVFVLVDSGGKQILSNQPNR